MAAHQTRQAQIRWPFMLFALVAILTGRRATPALAASRHNALPVDPNSMLLPSPTPDGRIEVTVALHVLNLSMISEVTERFQLTGYLLAQGLRIKIAGYLTAWKLM